MMIVQMTVFRIVLEPGVVALKMMHVKFVAVITVLVQTVQMCLLVIT